MIYTYYKYTIHQDGMQVRSGLIRDHNSKETIRNRIYKKYIKENPFSLKLVHINVELECIYSEPSYGRGEVND